MSLRTHRLDLTDRVDEMDERLDEIEDEKEDLMDRAREYKKEHGEDADLPDDLEYEWEDLEGEEIELRGDRFKFIQTVAVYSDAVEFDAEDLATAEEEEVLEAFGQVDFCEFTVKELTFGQLQGVSDDMMEESFEVDMDRQDIEGTPKQGYYQVELLREAIQSWPEHAPVRKDQYGNEQPAPGEYPIPVGEWLFERVDALNTSGDTEMGNSSLEEAMKFKD